MHGARVGLGVSKSLWHKPTFASQCSFEATGVSASPIFGAPRAAVGARTWLRTGGASERLAWVFPRWPLISQFVVACFSTPEVPVFVAQIAHELVLCAERVVGSQAKEEPTKGGAHKTLPAALRVGAV